MPLIFHWPLILQKCPPKFKNKSHDFAKISPDFAKISIDFAKNSPDFAKMFPKYAPEWGAGTLPTPWLRHCGVLIQHKYYGNGTVHY